MSKPSPPSPPDPVETAQAQAGSNVETAIANSVLNNVDYITPTHTQTWEMMDPYVMPGSNSAVDGDAPTDGSFLSGTEVPRWQSTITLTPGQQAIFDEGERAQLSATQAATMASNNVQNALANPVNLGDLPTGGVYDPNRQPELMQFDFDRMPELRTDFITAQGPGASGGVGTVSNINPILSMGNVSGGGGGGSVSYNRSDLGEILSEFGNTQNDVSYEFGQGMGMGDVQSVTDLLNGLEIDYTPTGEFGEILNSYGGDFSEERQRVEDALMDRMQPLLDRDREALEARLASQGLRYGAEAYQDAFGDFNRQTNDARLAAILNAGQEQSRLVNMERDRAMFANAAQNQDAQQILAREGLDMQAQLANADLQFNRASADSRLGLDMQQQDFLQQLARGEFFNNAQAQDFDQQFTRGQFFNDAQAQGAGQTLEQDRMDLQAQTSNQASGNAAASRALQAALANQNARLQEARFGLDAQAQQFNQALAQGQFYNDAQQQDFLNYQAGLGTFNNTAQQDYQNYLTGLTAQDDDRAQALSEQFAVNNNAVNQAAALLGATQMEQPTFLPGTNYGIGNVDYAGLVQDNYAQQVDAYNARAAANANIWNALGGMGSAWISR